MRPENVGEIDGLELGRLLLVKDKEAKSSYCTGVQRKAKR